LQRLRLCEGPIDLVIGLDGEARATACAFDAARERFESLLAELVAELPRLRQPLTQELPSFRGAIARRMAQVAWDYRGVFITPMVAVAGAVAEAMLAVTVEAAPLRRAFVNDGGDIALYLADGEHLDVGVVRSLERPQIETSVRITSDSPIRGIATSGWPGRSFSLGIADAVTTLARSAAVADAAATMVANAVNIDDPAILRRPARSLNPDSDLGDIAVTVAVGRLTSGQIEEALASGRRQARALVETGQIEGALLSLAGCSISVGATPPLKPAPSSILVQAACRAVRHKAQPS
jgi:ApbE superfamily uncharacterized protein (UPF0280 family)